ncbi:MAG: orotidine-5'-phosphate decarboxylase [Bdellovibrionaceae bacterium]|nr:orotidine-5'-phosphate decarboxylase [Pseudobdellovibrionaceae bacterium]
MNTSAPLRNPLCVALDVDSREEAIRLARDLYDIVGGFKIGPRLSMRYGEAIVRELSALAPVFVDNKYFDIPSTMTAAIRATFAAGASLATVHALAGKEALCELSRLEAELNAIRPFRILAVTLLTSWDESSYPPPLEKRAPIEHVKSLAQLCADSGIKGVVCSAQELKELGSHGLWLITPGIRFDLEPHDDQRRVMGPKEAMAAGASAIVVGRPIIRARNPREVAADYAMAVFGK